MEDYIRYGNDYYAGSLVYIEETGEVFGGDVLMQAGMLIAPLWGDYRSRLIHLTEA